MQTTIASIFPFFQKKPRKVWRFDCFYLLLHHKITIAMSNSFITNKNKYLPDIINGILPKTNAVDFLVGYFYSSGYKQLSDQLKDKHVRILVGLDIDIRMTTSLFKSDVQERNDKELVNAVAKIKALLKSNILPKDYLCDLITVIKADALSGYEIRTINQLTLKDAASLPQKITPEYIARIVSSQNKVDDGEETLIMSEELQ